MNCWLCSRELELVYESEDFSTKLFQCGNCDHWYEMKKDKVKVNGSVPVRFADLGNTSAIWHLLNDEAKAKVRSRGGIH